MAASWGNNAVQLPIIPDVELTEDLLQTNNLLLYGVYDSNAILAQFEGELPITFEGKTIHISDKSYTADGTAVFAVFPHPSKPRNAMLRCTQGLRRMQYAGGSHLDMQLLPDYIVYSGGQLLDWGFWGNSWKSQ